MPYSPAFVNELNILRIGQKFSQLFLLLLPFDHQPADLAAQTHGAPQINNDPTQHLPFARRMGGHGLAGRTASLER
jgi:hypothetical protein